MTLIWPQAVARPEYASESAQNLMILVDRRRAPARYDVLGLTASQHSYVAAHIHIITIMENRVPFLINNLSRITPALR
jgi:hypothetical protein